MLPRKFMFTAIATSVLMSLLCAVPTIPGADQPGAGWNARPSLSVPTPAVTVTIPDSQLMMADALAKSPPATANFRKALGAAAEKAYRDGQISRWDLARLRMAILLRPKAIDEAQACVTDEACAAGAMPMSAAGEAGFDWSQILSFIITKLPDIIALIKLFAV